MTIARYLLLLALCPLVGGIARAQDHPVNYDEA